MITFRPPTKKEMSLLRSLNSEFGIDMDRIIRGKRVVVGEGKRKEFFITNKATAQTLEEMKKSPYSVGLYIGEERGGSFILGLEGAEMIAKHCQKRIIVNQKAEQLVLYGRDIFPKSILDSSSGLRKGERALVYNERDEVIGIARVTLGKIFAENLVDRGWYLRKGE